MGGRNYLKRGISYLKRNGPTEALYKSLERLVRDRDEADYVPYHADEDTLAAQRKHEFIHPYRFSILVPVYETDPEIFRLMLQSVGNQTYGNWELILADASFGEERRAIVREFMEEYNLLCRDSFGTIHDKVRYIRTEGTNGISQNTNEALSHANGDYIALLDHDDVLESTALFDIMSAIENREESGKGRDQITKAALIYTDEDKISEDGSRFFDPNIKPDYDPVLLCTNNYICHFCVVLTSLAKSVGGFRPEYDGAQDHDFILRCTENIKPDEIIHIPVVLYHWRSTEGSTSENPESKLYAYEAGRHAVEDHLNRRGIKAKVTNGIHLGYFEIEYERHPQKAICLTMDEFVEFSEVLDRAVGTGYVMILAHDLEPLDKDYLTDMMTCMRLPGIGAVTGKIIGRNRKVESAGFDTDEDGNRVPRFRNLWQHFSGTMHRASVDQTVKGFSQDCVLIRMNALDPGQKGLKLKAGFDIYYRHKAIFKRKAI